MDTGFNGPALCCFIVVANRMSTFVSLSAKFSANKQFKSPDLAIKFIPSSKANLMVSSLNDKSAFGMSTNFGPQYKQSKQIGLQNPELIFYKELEHFRFILSSIL